MHFGVSALYGVKLDAVRISARIYRRNRTAAQSDAVVVAANHHHLVAFSWFALQAIALCAVTHTACQHDNLVVSIERFVGRVVCFGLLLMLEGKNRTRDKGLTKLIAKVGCTVRCLDEYLFGRLVEPLAYWK